nr:immunoglobulin light chain junction region [Macaca mulatta]
CEAWDNSLSSPVF